MARLQLERLGGDPGYGWRSVAKSLVVRAQLWSC